VTDAAAIDRLAERLSEVARGSVRRDHKLGDLTTYRLGGPAAILVEPMTEEQLLGVARTLREHPEIPVLTLGRGSNLVVSDHGWSGVVIRLGSSFFGIAEPDGHHLVAGAATPLPQLCNRAARRGLAGLEFMIAIPGSVGGAVRMNAGAHGCDTSDVLQSARIVNLDLADATDVAAGDLDLGYRHSNITDRSIVVSARFGLEPGDPAAIRAQIDGYRRHRAETQPGAVQNAGSVFKNPPGHHAGRLVDMAGLKGLRVGGAHVSELHANFFMASPEATSQDVYDLVCEVKRQVRQLLGVDLDPEIRFAGRFEAENQDVEVMAE
jgi:UDP-N-acetylmuramate dehydrogenase